MKYGNTNVNHKVQDRFVCDLEIKLKPNVY